MYVRFIVVVIRYRIHSRCCYILFILAKPKRAPMPNTLFGCKPQWTYDSEIVRNREKKNVSIIEARRDEGLDNYGEKCTSVMASKQSIPRGNLTGSLPCNGVSQVLKALHFQFMKRSNSVEIVGQTILPIQPHES